MENTIYNPNYMIKNGKRKIAWLETGDPDGFPIIYAHGNPGCRLELLFLAQKARQHGLRLLVFERPGLGRSTYVKGYPLHMFATDVKDFADMLAIETFGMIGWSSGGPPVLATAHYLPQQVAFAFSISGYTNFGEFPDAKDLMDQYHLRGVSLSENHHMLFNRIMEVVRWINLNLPNFYLKLAKEEMTSDDRQILSQKDIADLFSEVQQEAVINGIDGVIQDLETQWHPWEFSLNDIHVPVHIFQGKQDVFVPFEFALDLADRIPNAKLHLFEDQGHLFMLRQNFQDELFMLAINIVDHL